MTEASVALLESLHQRWVIIRNLALYAWHGRHHVAPITSPRERMGW